MLDLIVLNAAACANGQCPPQQTVTLVQQPAVVAVAQAVPGKVVTQYRRGLFGKLRPSQSTVTTTASEPKAAKGSACKGGCK